LRKSMNLITLVFLALCILLSSASVMNAEQRKIWRKVPMIKLRFIEKWTMDKLTLLFIFIVIPRCLHRGAPPPFDWNLL